MLPGFVVCLVRIRVTVVYAAIVTGVTMALLFLSPQIHDRVIRHASTNLHNLSHGHIGTLLGSAFVVDAGPIYLWLPGLMCLMAVAELYWSSGRLVLAFSVGHVGATLLVALGLTAAIERGWLPGSLTRATDVGMSYGAAAVLGSLTAAIPRRWRPAWVGWWLAVGIVAIVLGGDFTDVGHAVALGLGMLVSTRFGEAGMLSRVGVALLGVAASFGFLLLANSGPSLAVPTACGLLGAAVLGVAAPRMTHGYAVESSSGHRL